MNIYAKSGDKVIAKHLNNGWDYDKKQAQRLLTQDQEYTVAFTSVHSFSTQVHLVEFPNECFNSVHFVDVPNNKYLKTYHHSDFVGYGFECLTCKQLNKLVDEEELRQFCNYCGKINTFEYVDILEDSI